MTPTTFFIGFNYDSDNYHILQHPLLFINLQLNHILFSIYLLKWGLAPCGFILKK